MPGLSGHIRKVQLAAIVVLGGLSLSACATRSYVDEQIAMVNTHINAVDAKASDALQRAEAANSAAQSAGSAAQAAMAAAQNANSRLDQLTTRVDTIEQSASKPRRARH